MGEDRWRVAPYTDEDLPRQVDQLDDLYGDDGRIQQDADSYVAGINRYISEARLDPTKTPASTWRSTGRWARSRGGRPT